MALEIVYQELENVYDMVALGEPAENILPHIVKAQMQLEKRLLPPTWNYLHPDGNRHTSPQKPDLKELRRQNPVQKVRVVKETTVTTTTYQANEEFVDCYDLDDVIGPESPKRANKKKKTSRWARGNYD